MASIEPRINANGVITSYRIIVSDGADYQGNPIKYRMLWTPPRRNMTEKQIQKELSKITRGFLFLSDLVSTLISAGS